jgi:hypothetical protein
MQRFDDPATFSIQFSCSPIATQPMTAMGMEVWGHGGAARVVGLSATDDGGVMLRSIQTQPEPGGNDATNPRVAFYRSRLEPSRAHHTFDTIRAALASSILKGAVPPSDGAPSESMTMTTARLSLEVYLNDAAGAHAERAYSGYVGSFRATERVPVVVAWQALASGTAPAEAAQNTPEELDRELLLKVWSAARQRPWFAERALLQAAAIAGSPRLIPLIVPALSSEQPRMQQLAVAALAAISGWDVRRDASGAERPWATVVADYMRECSAE